MNQRTAQIIRFSALITPVALTLYGILALYGAVDRSHFVNAQLFLVVMVLWIGAAAYQFLFPTTKHRRLIGFFGAYHILAIVYLVTVSGFSMPFLVVWILLLLASYAYFGANGSKASIASIVVAVLIDALIHGDNTSIMITDLISMLAIIVAGIGIISISHAQTVDASELERSHQLESLQRERIMTIINNLADAIISTDAHGVVNVYNAACLNLLDTNEGLDGKSIDAILTLHDTDKKPFDLLAQLRSSRGVVVRDDLLYPISDDEAMRLELTYSPIRGSYSEATAAGDHDGYIIILRDITKSKSLEEERDEFISVVSHELRTPITIAEGSVSNLQLMNERGLLTKDKSADIIKSTHDQILFLASMVNDLSTLSRAERGVADTAELIDVRTLVSDLYNQYLPEANDRGLHLNLDIKGSLGSVKASRLYLQELLQNFITNSLKYTKEGSITMDIERKANRVHFIVRDTGIGMSKADQEKIFNKFYRAEDYRTRETSGTGLGLYVGAKLARKLGTKIELTSRLNHGSSFRFSLPAEAAVKK